MIRIPDLFSYKQRGEKFTCLTAYDASFSHCLGEAGVDVILVGDSLGNVIQGHGTTVPVSMDDMVYHTACVARGNTHSLLMSDLPFMAYATLEQSLHHAARLMQAGAHMVKLEGGAWLAPTVRALTERGIPVCAHLGLTPQSVHMLGGFKVQGKTYDAAETLKQDALTLEAAGAKCLVIECIPSHLAATLTQLLAIPVIGIGAGQGVDGQILVLYDILGITPGRAPKFSKNFLLEHSSIQSAIKAYVNAVKTGSFPAVEHEFVV